MILFRKGIYQCIQNSVVTYKKLIIDHQKGKSKYKKLSNENERVYRNLRVRKTHYK